MKHPACIANKNTVIRMCSGYDVDVASFGLVATVLEWARVNGSTYVTLANKPEHRIGHVYYLMQY